MFEGRWRVDRALGEGGFAIVYAAFDQQTSERVAIKLLKPDAPPGYDLETARRFRREADALSRLESQSTVRLIGHGETASGVLYLVFEHVDGEELSELLDRRGRLEQSELLHILEQLLLALEEAHQKGLLHRDLKPSNVLVHERDGTLAVKLIDFGIARSLDPNVTSITQTGSLLGTPRYMSPEQLLAQPLTPASDIYSLGLVAFEMALGRDALPGGAIGDQIDRLLSGHVFSVPELDRVGARLHSVISRMCARRKEDRFQSAEAVLIALGLRAKSRHVVGDRPRSRALLVGGALLCAVIVALAIASQRDSEPAPVRPQYVQPTVRIATPTETESQKPPSAMPVSELKSWHSAGCLAPPKAAPENLKFPHLDTRRPIPLVVLFHDVGVNHIAFLKQSGFESLAEEHEFAVLSVEGRRTEVASRNPWKRAEARELTGEGSTPIDDAMAEVGATLNGRCIDLRRVYAVGHGHGGDAADRATCARLFTGVATVGWVGHNLEFCKDPPRLDRIRFAALSDENSPLFGGPLCRTGRRMDTPLNELDEALATAVGCTPKTPRFRDNSKPQRRVWTCAEGAYESRLVQGGRPWPGVKFDPDSDPDSCHGTPTRVDYASEIWAFFEASWNERQAARDQQLLSRGCDRSEAGVPRGLVYHVPSGHTGGSPLPLVVLVHDDKVDAGAFLAQSGFVPIADRERFAVLVPQGTRVGTWKFGSHREVRQSFEAFTDHVCVDLNQVYAVGNNRGGAVLDAIACEKWFRAVAVNSHAPRQAPQAIEEKLKLNVSGHRACATTEVRPTLILRPEFGPCDVLDHDEWVSKYVDERARLFGCDVQRSKTRFGSVSCDMYAECDADVVMCLLPGSVWPDTDNPCDRGPEYRHTAEVIWDFFALVRQRAEHEIDGE